MTKKIICVWIGTLESEDDLYKNYLNFDYEDEDNPESQFGKDSELGYYDEDFMESWWFEKIDLNILTEYKGELPDSEYFFDELIVELKNRDLNNRNFISFLFGENGKYTTNKMLFEYDGMKKNNKPIEFVFKKEYDV